MQEARRESSTQERRCAQLERAFQELKKRCRAEALELSAFFWTGTTTRFARSTIHQNIFEEKGEVLLKLKKGRALGLASTNHLERASLRQALSQAKEGLSRAPKREPQLALPTPIPVCQAVDASVPLLSPQEKAVALQQLFFAEKKFLFSGAYRSGLLEMGVINTQGVFCTHAVSIVQFLCIAERGAASGYSVGHHWRGKGVNLRAIQAEALAKLSRVRSGEVPPGEYPVVLEPQAVADLLHWMGWIGWSGQGVVEKTSFLSASPKRLKRLDPKLTVCDDGLDSRGIPLPFDGEGVRREKVVLVERGRLGPAVYNLHTSRLAGAANTGHALPASPPEAAPVPLNLLVESGASPVQDLLAPDERAILVTRFHYLNGLLDPPRALLTGLTRDGTFLVHKGKKVARLKNLRFTDSLLRAFSQVEAVSRERKIVPLSDWALLGTCLSPTIRLRSLRFSASTSF